MLQCESCEFFHRGPNGEIALSCDPFANVKEPECLAKWHLVKINQMVGCYQATLRYYEKFAPMQEKMFNYMEKELNDLNESDQWKSFDDEDSDEDSDMGLDLGGTNFDDEDWK